MNPTPEIVTAGHIVVVGWLILTIAVGGLLFYVARGGVTVEPEEEHDKPLVERFREAGG